jgi:hypothetical protein
VYVRFEILAAAYFVDDDVGIDVVSTRKQAPTFLMNILPPSSGLNSLEVGCPTEI